MKHRSFLLELASKADFLPKAFSESGISVVQASTSDVDLCRHLWVEVGRGFWNEREDWTLERWRTYLSDEAISFWIAKKGSRELGFFELARDKDGIKIEGLGLLPQWRNRGLGGGLLSAATQQAFDYGAKRIWLHTATDDHPNALPNYQKRGYRVYDEDELRNPMPDHQSHRESHGDTTR
jgi:ribosomal protein S18 acetylase RimI-like enzyme